MIICINNCFKETKRQRDKKLKGQRAKSQKNKCAQKEKSWPKKDTRQNWMQLMHNVNCVSCPILRRRQKLGRLLDRVKKCKFYKIVNL